MIIGIDPGISGAIAFMHDGNVTSVIDMPTTRKTTGKGLQIDAHELASLLSGYNSEIHNNLASYRYCYTMVIVEAVSAMPNQGVSSMFSFGKSAGIIEGVLAANRLQYSFVRPQQWKKMFGLSGKDKDASRELCIRDHPEIAHRLQRKKDHGRAEAILIAKFGERQ